MMKSFQYNFSTKNEGQPEGIWLFWT